MKRALLTLALLVCTASLASAGAVKGTYLGTSKTTVKYLDLNTQQVLSTKSYTCNETVVIGVPKKAGVQFELNPFSLTILATTPKTPPVNGDVKAGSARIFPVPGGGSMVVQYWLLEDTATGFTGTLIDIHYLEGLARDRVIAKFGNTSTGYKMLDARGGSAYQCKIAATVTGRLMTLTVTGYAYVPGQALIQFTTKITARR